MSWRDSIPVHPAADLFPLLDDADLVALGEDIKRNGLTSPIAIVVENDKPVLVDGRNRLAALERVGLRFKLEYSGSGWFLVAEKVVGGDEWVDEVQDIANTVIIVDGDPVEYITSANIHRRHLTAETKRELIAALIKENPAKSDRQIAETIKASPTTVGTVRAKTEASGTCPRLDTRLDSKGRQQPAHKPKSAPAATSLTRAELRDRAEQIETDGWLCSLSGMAAESIALQEYWTKEYRDWKQFRFPVDSEHYVTLAKQTAAGCCR